MLFWLYDICDVFLASWQAEFIRLGVIHKMIKNGQLCVSVNGRFAKVPTSIWMSGEFQFFLDIGCGCGWVWGSNCITSPFLLGPRRVLIEQLEESSPIPRWKLFISTISLFIIVLRTHSLSSVCCEMDGVILMTARRTDKQASLTSYFYIFIIFLANIVTDIDISGAKNYI